MRGDRYCSSDDIISSVRFLESERVVPPAPPANGTNKKTYKKHYQINEDLARCNARAILFRKEVDQNIQQHVCPNITRVVSSAQPVIGIQALLGQGNKVRLPCLNPSKTIAVPGLVIDNKSRVKSGEDCGKYGSYEDDGLKDVYIPTERVTPALQFAESNPGFKSAFGQSLKADHSVHFYSYKRINTPEEPACRDINADNLHNFSEEINTWYKTIAVLTSIALALTVIGLLICICYIVLKKVRAFRKPIVYAVVYMLAFIVACLLIAQGIYYFVVRDHYSISSGYQYFQHLIINGCLPAGFGKAAIDINNYVDESVWKIAPFIILLFVWSILFIVVFLACWVIGRIKRQAICNRPF